MPKKQKPYKRLPGKKKNFLGGLNTLWLGADHVLSIDSKRVSEDYKRFYYTDIQSVVTRNTIRGKIQNLFLGLFCGLLTLLAALIGGSWVIFFGIMAGLFFLILLFNCLLGPTCECHLKTAVQTEKLPSLHRLRYVRKAMDRLRPLIEQAQGTLTSEAIEENALKESRQAASPSDSGKARKALRHEHGSFHAILFCLLLAWGLFAGIFIFYNHVALTLLSSAITMATGVFMIIALVKQHDSDMKDSVRAITWTTLGFVCLDFFLSYILFFVTAVKHPEAIRNQWELFKAFSSLSPMDSPWLMGITVFSVVCSFILGISGLILLKGFQQEHK
ncbi:MAG: hypothetical protein JRJ86_07960 [Deltaproteobacteria bacterium]|nr:hypothetical protein [Deltaproteobacteria bacterium]MBW2117622.1 hypothetical protein [Deltaproteobacteria bacterium]MBW2343950.1 hypothetical protein [Deltaproteobacteria bacterium]